MHYSLAIQKAIRFSLKTHEVYQKQKRKGKDIPYITHPLIVGMILSRAGASEDVVIAGILHDTIEDSIPEKKVTKEMIAERFGDVVAEIVDDVTEQDRELSWQERKAAALDHVEHLQNNSLMVKSADLISNMSEMLADFETEGEAMFERFNAPKQKILAHYQHMIDAVVKRWTQNPLIDDLKDLDVMSMDMDKRREHKGEPMPFVSAHGKSQDEIVNQMLDAVEHPSHRAVSFDADEALRLYKIAGTFIEGALSQEKPKFILVMGGVASGKTTIRKAKYSSGYVNIEYGEIYTAVKNEFGKENDRLRVYTQFVCDTILRDAITEKKHIVTELIGDDYDKLVPVISSMKEIGYEMEVAGITADLEESRERHLKAVKEDPDYLSAYFTQDSTLAFFYSYFDLPNNPGVDDMPTDA